MSKKAKIPRRPTPPPAPPAPKKCVWHKPWFWIVLAVVLTAAVVLTVCWVVKPPAKKAAKMDPVNTEVSATLDECVRQTLIAEHHSDHTDSKYPVVTYTPLHIQEGEEGIVTMYGVMMYREYTATTDNELKVWGAAHSPFALTAQKTDEGYALVECWWPGSGAAYRSSIEKKFPANCREDAIQSQKYFAAHDAVCKADAEANIAQMDKYVVMQSEKENLRVAYCPQNGASYVIFAAGYNTDGAYATEGENKVVLSFGDRKVVFSVDGDAWIYNEKESANLPAEWKKAGDAEYFVDGVRFVPADGAPAVPDEDTAPVGPTFTASSSGWMNEQELREMFGQYMVSNFPYDSADVHYLPVMTIKYRGDLENFLAAYQDDPQWPELKMENFAQYDEAFFKDNYLMMTYYKDGYASSVPTVSSYVFAEDGAWLSVRLQVEKLAVGDTVVGQWLLFSGIAKEDHKRFTNGIEAYVEKTVTAEDLASDFTLTGTVKEVDGRAMLLECENHSQFTTVWVELGTAELDPIVGETYVVTYEDIAMPSLPPRITAVTITKP